MSASQGYCRKVSKILTVYSRLRGFGVDRIRLVHWPHRQVVSGVGALVVALLAVFARQVRRVDGSVGGSADGQQDGQEHQAVVEAKKDHQDEYLEEGHEDVDLRQGEKSHRQEGAEAAVQDGRGYRVQGAPHPVLALPETDDPMVSVVRVVWMLNGLWRRVHERVDHVGRKVHRKADADDQDARRHWGKK